MNAKADASALPSFDKIFELNDYWNTSGIGFGQYADWGNLGVLVTDYDLLIIHFRYGEDSTLSNGGGTIVVPTSEINLNYSEANIQQGKQGEFVYIYPAANPSWYISVAWGFREVTVGGNTIHRLCAIKRTSNNFVTWNIPKVYGIKF